MAESYLEIAVARDNCLSSLIGQAEGRTIDNRTDQILVEQINASHVEDVATGSITACMVGECAFRCLTNNDDGILLVVDTSGTPLCEQ